MMNENNPIQVLMDEHDVIALAQEAIEKMNNLWETDESTYASNVSVLLNFFKAYSDKYHHHKEEEVLFPAMVNHPEFTQHEIISELEEHHSMFRDYTNDIGEALEQKAWASIQELLGKYINDLLDHIAAENDEVFIMAESLFSEEELERFYFQFQDIDHELGMDNKQSLVESIQKIALQ